MPPPRITVLALTADLVAVVVFAALGRVSHGEDGMMGLVTTAAPFVFAVLAAWATPWARAEPAGLRAGGLTLAVTVVLGMLLRWGFTGRMPPWQFVVVTLVSLGVLMLGWRVLAAVTRARVSRGSARR